MTPRHTVATSRRGRTGHDPSTPLRTPIAPPEGGETTGLLYEASLDPADGRRWICSVTAPLTPAQAAELGAGAAAFPVLG